MSPPRPNRLYLTLSLALILFLLGLVAWWALQARQLARQLQEDLDILVELRRDVPPPAIDSLLTHLRTAPYLQEGSEPTLIPKEEALGELGNDVAGDLVELGINNPLVDVVTFNATEAYLTEGRLDSIAATLQLLPGVGGVYYQDNLVGRVVGNARKLGYGLLGLTVLFLFVAALLIHNSVRLSLYADRSLIRTQELVGASWGFIGRPYLWGAFWQGLTSAVLALTAIVALHLWVRWALPELELPFDPYVLGALAGGLVGLGVGVNLLSHYVVVRRYLRLRLDELY